MKRVRVLVSVAWLVVLFPLAGLSAGSVQGEKQGVAVFKEAQELRTKARTKGDLEEALVKYQQALDMFQRAGSDKWQGLTLNNMSIVYR